MRTGAWFGWLVLGVGLGFMASACGDAPTGALSEPPVAAALTLASDSTRSIFSGRGADEPFRVLARDASGRPAANVEVTFTISGSAGGALSQPVARTNSQGFAETQLLESTPGEGSVVASSGAASVSFVIVVERAPGRIEFESDSSGFGLPGLTHPDSMIEVRVFDTEGAPLAGTAVWFASGGTLSRFSDTTDTQGRASTILRRSRLAGSEERVIAFIIGFPKVTHTIGLGLRQPAERVVLVSIEGLRADAIAQWQPPTLSALLASGATWSDARTILPTLTVPAHLSMWSGQGPDAHGVANDTLRFTPEMANLDPLFRSAGRRGRASAAFLSDEGPLGGFGDLLRCRLAFGFDSLTFGAPDAGVLAALAAPALIDPALDLVFVHFPDPDLAGHTFGFTSAEYGASVLDADRALATLVETMDFETTLLIVTAPHGGGGAFGEQLHGSGADADVLIPLILRGPGVIAGERTVASVLDVAPTALWALGLAPPARYEGRVLLDGFSPR